MMKVGPGERKSEDESWRRRGRRASAHCGGEIKCTLAGRGVALGDMRPLALDWGQDWRGFGAVGV